MLSDQSSTEKDVSSSSTTKLETVHRLITGVILTFQRFEYFKLTFLCTKKRKEGFNYKSLDGLSKIKQ